jgi:hypothetical protein
VCVSLTPVRCLYEWTEVLCEGNAYWLVSTSCIINTWEILIELNCEVGRVCATLCAYVQAADTFRALTGLTLHRQHCWQLSYMCWDWISSREYCVQRYRDCAMTARAIASTADSYRTCVGTEYPAVNTAYRDTEIVPWPGAPSPALLTAAVHVLGLNIQPWILRTEIQR